MSGAVEVHYLVLVAVRDLENRAAGHPRESRDLSFEGGFLFRTAGIDEGGSADVNGRVSGRRGRDPIAGSRQAAEDRAIAERLASELARWARLQNAS